MAEERFQARSVSDILRELTSSLPDKDRIIDTVVGVAKDDYQAFKFGTEDSRTIFAVDFRPLSKSNWFFARLPLQIVLPGPFFTTAEYDLIAGRVFGAFMEDVYAGSQEAGKGKRLPEPVSQPVRNFMAQYPGEKVNLEYKTVELVGSQGETRIMLQERFIDPYLLDPLSEVWTGIKYPNRED